MKTSFLLLAQYDGMAVIPVEWVCRDYFRHLTVEKFLRKVLAGEIDLPVVRIETSQKSAKGIHVRAMVRHGKPHRAGNASPQSKLASHQPKKNDVELFGLQLSTRPSLM